MCVFIFIHIYRSLRCVCRYVSAMNLCNDYCDVVVNMCFQHGSIHIWFYTYMDLHQSVIVHHRSICTHCVHYMIHVIYVWSACLTLVVDTSIADNRSGFTRMHHRLVRRQFIYYLVLQIIHLPRSMAWGSQERTDHIIGMVSIIHCKCRP